VTHMHDRWGRGAVITQRAELERERRKLNRQAVTRIATEEAEELLPRLEQAAAAAEEGRALHSLATFSGDRNLETELGGILRRVAVAAAPEGVRRRS
jgi:hypothetical protein